MNDTQVAAALKAAKDELESKAAVLREKIVQAQHHIDVYQKKLDRLYLESEAQVRDLTRRYLEIPESSNPSTPADRAEGRTRKWSLDEPVLQMIHQMPSPVVAVPDVWTLWNREHYDRRVGRTTVRGILERLVRDGELRVIEHGRPGRKRVRLYQLASVSNSHPEEEEAAATTQ